MLSGIKSLIVIDTEGIIVNRLIFGCMMSWKGICRLSTASFLLLFLTSCIIFSDTTPHENFKNLMASNLGSSIDKPRLAGSALSKYLLNSVILSNGNIENEYRGRATCRKFFEFNPKTRIIVNWRFTGSEKDCIIPL